MKYLCIKSCQTRDGNNLIRYCKEGYTYDFTPADAQLQYFEEVTEDSSGGAGDNVLDLDGDGKPDTILVAEDADSINIDTDGDGVADIVIPK